MPILGFFKRFSGLGAVAADESFNTSRISVRTLPNRGSNRKQTLSKQLITIRSAQLLKAQT
jgi:hypothetical protein